MGGGDLIIFKYREVNPYKKVATFESFFLCTHVDQSVEHIFNKVKKVCYKIIFINKSIYYINLFTKIFNRYSILSEIQEIGGHHENKEDHRP